MSFNLNELLHARKR